MDNGTGLSASDALLLGGNAGGGFGGSSFMWIFGLLILMGMFNGGFGGWGNNRFDNAIGYENLATSNEVQRGFDNQNSMANQRDILAAVSNGTAQAIAATNSTAFNNINVVKDAQMQLQERLADLHVNQQNMLANQNACCCDTKMLIQSTSATTDANIAQDKYDTMMALAGMEQRLTSKMDANKIDELQNQVNALQLQNAMAGVVKYPMVGAYSTPMPWWGNGCGCNA